MLVRNITLPLINYLKFTSISSKSSYFYTPNLFSNNNRYLFSSSSQFNDNKNSQQTTTYMPIRPLKKNITPLYVDKEYLNKGQVLKPIPIWPFFTPFLAMCINNYLTTWSVTNSTIASALFVLGFIVRSSPQTRRQHEIIKFQCNQSMTKFYITIHDSLQTQIINKYYPKSYKADQEWKVFTEQQLKNTEYVPTQEEKNTLTPAQLQAKKQQFDNKLIKKILKQNKLRKSISRYQLDASKTRFELSDIAMQRISDQQQIHPPVIHVQQMLNMPLKYLIVRTQFLTKNKKPIHFFMDLQRNGDLKYQDYLVALGLHAKIVQNAQTK